MMVMSRPIISPAKVIGRGYNRFWHDRHFYRVVKGSRGSKKSRTTAINFIYRLMKYPWANLLVVRRYSKTNKDSTYTVLKWASHRLQVGSLFKFNESLPEITYLPTGQKILFRGLDDPLKITSIDVDVGILCWAWFEEGFELESEDKFRTVVESIRGSNDSQDFFKQVTITFNPWSEKHWLKRVFFDPDTQEDDTFAITTTFLCNEWLDEGDRKRYESLYRTNPRRARIVCDGDWGIAEGLVYERFKVEDFDKEDVLRRVQKTAFGLDFGYSHDPTAFVALALDRENKKLYVFDELYEVGLNNVKIADRLKKKGYQRSMIIADSAEPKSIDELSMFGLSGVRPAAKGKDSIQYGIQYIENYEIIIHPSCVHFNEEINNYVYAKDREGNTLNVPIDDFNHLMDAMRYAMEQYSIKQDYTHILPPTLGGF